MRRMIKMINAEAFQRLTKAVEALNSRLDKNEKEMTEIYKRFEEKLAEEKASIISSVEKLLQAHLRPWRF